VLRTRAGLSPRCASRWYMWSQSRAEIFQSGMVPSSGIRWRWITLTQSWRVVGDRVAVFMNVSSNVATVTLQPPWSPAPLSVTNRCNAMVASVLVPRKVRESRRVSPVIASGSDVVCRRHRPGDRSVKVPVRGFTTEHSVWESHQNRTKHHEPGSQSGQGNAGDVFCRPEWGIAPERTMQACLAAES
jgi:hypothetical protein